MDSLLKIGLARGGTLGDNLQATALVAAIKRKFPLSTLDVFVHNLPEILSVNPLVTSATRIPVDVFDERVSKIAEGFDIFFNCRCYVSRLIFSGKALSNPVIRKFKEEWEFKWKTTYERVYNDHLEKIESTLALKKTVHEILIDSSNLEASVDEMFYPITDKDRLAAERFKDYRYATLHVNPGKGGQSKKWPMVYWNDVAKYLKTLGILPIQLGLPGEELIAGDEKFEGTIGETAAVLKRARFHIDIEGGLVHLAKTIGTRSIVLFGPTPKNMFGYDSNINLQTNMCPPCFWKDRHWYNHCKVQKDYVCMWSIKPEMVYQAIRQELNENHGYNLK